MTQADINRKVQFFDLAAQRERQRSPKMVQETKAVRHPVGSGSGVRLAYCKEDAPGDNTIDCYLDTNETGTEVAVTCHICKGSALNEATPRLADNDEIFVIEIGGTWYCITTFHATEDCDCYEA